MQKRPAQVDRNLVQKRADNLGGEQNPDEDAREDGEGNADEQTDQSARDGQEAS